MRSIKRNLTKKRKSKNNLPPLTIERARRFIFSRRIYKYAFIFSLSGLLIAVLWVTLHPAFWFNYALSKANDKFITYSRNIGFKVKDIYIEGRNNLPLELLTKEIKLNHNESIFIYSPESIKQRLENIPWIKSASVYRQLPNAFYIRIHERQPIAIWQNQKSYFLIDYDGTVIDKSNIQLHKKLPIVVGEKAPKYVHQIIEKLKSYPVIYKQLTGLVFVSERRWNLQLNGATLIKLPEKNVEESLKRMMKIIESKKIQLIDIEVMDLRIDQQYIIKLLPLAKSRLNTKGTET